MQSPFKISSSSFSKPPSKKPSYSISGTTNKSPIRSLSSRDSKTSTTVASLERLIYDMNSKDLGNSNKPTRPLTKGGHLLSNMDMVSHLKAYKEEVRLLKISIESNCEKEKKMANHIKLLEKENKALKLEIAETEKRFEDKLAKSVYENNKLYKTINQLFKKPKDHFFKKDVGTMTDYIPRADTSAANFKIERLTKKLSEIESVSKMLLNEQNFSKSTYQYDSLEKKNKELTEKVQELCGRNIEMEMECETRRVEITKMLKAYEKNNREKQFFESLIEKIFFDKERKKYLKKKEKYKKVEESIPSCIKAISIMKEI